MMNSFVRSHGSTGRIEQSYGERTKVGEVIQQRVGHNAMMSHFKGICGNVSMCASDTAQCIHDRLEIENMALIYHTIQHGKFQ
jgi:hypothetical protein